MKQLLIIGLLPLLVAGCLSPAERFERDRKYASNECRKIGYKVGSTEYKQCIERGINNKREAQRRAAAAAGEILRKQEEARQRQFEQHRLLNRTCRTTYHGNTATTRCN